LVKRDHQDDVVGPWAEEKLEALERYLDYYCTRLSKKKFIRIYIDGFAGAPLNRVRKKEAPPAGEPLPFSEEDDELRDQLVLGSPVRALRTEPGFHRHFFFDLDERRVRQLEDLKVQYPTKLVTVKVGDANEQVRDLMAAIGGRRDVKGVAFLDPYKANLEWETLRAIAATGSFEVLINLPLHMAINRLLKREDRNAEWEADIDRCFGTTEWRDLVYPEKPDLFGDLIASKADRVCDLLLKLYSGRLEALFGFVAPAKLIRNTRKSPLYFLLWAGPHPAGLVGAKYILTDQPKLALGRRS
jgi:three-Cys-motif partner protein